MVESNQVAAGYGSAYKESNDLQALMKEFPHVDQADIVRLYYEAAEGDFQNA